MDLKKQKSGLDEANKSLEIKAYQSEKRHGMTITESEQTGSNSRDAQVCRQYQSMPGDTCDRNAPYAPIGTSLIESRLYPNRNATKY